MADFLTNPTPDEKKHWDDVVASTNGIEGLIPLMPSAALEHKSMVYDPNSLHFSAVQDHAMAQGVGHFLGPGPQFTIISTAGGLHGADGKPLALGLHTGHTELNLLKEAAAKEFTKQGAIPYSVDVSDPCDGRTQGTEGMMDSLPYRNDAAIVMGRLARSHPTRKGVLGIATCDKGLPAMMMALATMHDEPTVIVPGGTMLAVKGAKEDTASVQSLPFRLERGEISPEDAQREASHTCGSPGGGCQFLGTAATSQVVGEALGMSIPHSALTPSGLEIWKDMGKRSAEALVKLHEAKITTKEILTDDAIHNAMVIHAAFGGSTNLLLHVPAIAHAAGLKMPTREDWEKINRETPRLVDVLPNSKYPTVYAFLAGGVPEVMLQLRELDKERAKEGKEPLLRLNAMTVTGKTVGDNIQEWEHSKRRDVLRTKLQELEGVDPNDVICPPERAKEKGLTGTITFPEGNIAPEGSVIKSTAIDSKVVDADGVYRKIGKARVFTSEPAAVEAVAKKQVHDGDVIVLIGVGPKGTGMEETYRLTRALKDMEGGGKIPLITDGRFSGVSTGACIGHVGPEALAGGPIGKVKDGDIIQIEIDRNNLTGKINFVGMDINHPITPEKGAKILAARPAATEIHPDLRPHPHLPAHTQMWAAILKNPGCVYDPDSITHWIEAGKAVEMVFGEKVQNMSIEEIKALLALQKGSHTENLGRRGQGHTR